MGTTAVVNKSTLNLPTVVLHYLVRWFQLSDMPDRRSEDGTVWSHRHEIAMECDHLVEEIADNSFCIQNGTSSIRGRDDFIENHVEMNRDTPLARRWADHVSQTRDNVKSWYNDPVTRLIIEHEQQRRSEQMRERRE